MLTTPDSLIAQSSGRPASVSLTVVEPSRVSAGVALTAIPVEYRITVGASDQIVVWTIPSLFHLDATR